MIVTGTEFKSMLIMEHWQAFDGDDQIGTDQLTIGPNSVDVSLSPKIKIPHPSVQEVSIDQPATGDLYHDGYIPEYGYILRSGDFILACTRERFVTRAPMWIPGSWNVRQECRPYVAQMYDGRSTMGRLGLMSHVTAGFGDYGFEGCFTLELKNVAPWDIKLVEGTRIGQVSFHVLVGDRPNSYDGQYNHNNGPVGPGGTR
jgi:dCTP deaminase